jgi:hypothetical protein
MKKLTSLLIFVGLAFNVSGQEEPKNLKEAMDASKAHWIIGDWETKNENGTTYVVSFKWAVKDGVVSVQVSRDGEKTREGVIGFDLASGKVVGKTMSNNGASDTEWTVVDGKLTTISKGAWRNEAGEINRYSIARLRRKIDENTMETTVHELTATGEVGEVALRSDGAKRISKWNRKKP